jgi:hypothetical protein
MTTQLSRWLLQRKWIVAAVSLPILVALWWAFRPEKLWINERVNEAAPFDASVDPKPVLTGRFETKSQPTSGRATIYRKPSGHEYLRLSDFSAPNGEDLHVELKGDLNGADLGPLKNIRGDQDYELPAATDAGKYEAVAIYSERLHTVIGLAKLEPF